MTNRALAPAALLLVALIGCGGGGTAPATDPAAAAAAAAGDEGGPAPAAKPAATAQKPKPRIDESLIPEPGKPLPREEFSYSGASRDPFESVLLTGTVGPELPDLDLVGVYYFARNPAASAAVLRDRVSGKSFTVREGARLGRMRVNAIRAREVEFTIDDYGTERHETLSIRKPEGAKP